MFFRFVGNAFDVELFYRYEIPVVRGRDGVEGMEGRGNDLKYYCGFKPYTRETSAAGWARSSRKSMNGRLGGVGGGICVAPLEHITALPPHTKQ